MEPPEQIKQALREIQATEAIRVRQQGYGLPIVSWEADGFRIVAVGSTVHWSKAWNTFHDFLLDYIKKVLGTSWGNAEIAKPYNRRHPILQWYHQVCQLQAATIKKSGAVTDTAMTGAVSAYMRLAYNLYLLAHNTKSDGFDSSVQKELIQRIKHRDMFQGAYFEAEVFGALIKAGFEIAFEDQSGKLGKRCEATVRFKETGEQFSVEAKTIHRKGILGADQNAAEKDKPLSASLRNQLYDALQKTAPHPRIIFIDVNTSDDPDNPEPTWINEAVDAVANAENLTIRGKESEPAYVILTNRPDYHDTQATKFRSITVGIGYKIPEFGSNARIESLIDQYHAKQKHLPVHRILNSLVEHSDIPSTFSGEIPSVAFGRSDPPIMIGERCAFENAEGEYTEAIVTSAMVDESNKLIVVGTDRGHILRYPISDSLLTDFHRFGDAIFGMPKDAHQQTNHPFEFFEFMLETYMKSSKEKLLEFMSHARDYEDLKTKSQEELALIYCERSTYAALSRGN